MSELFFKNFRKKVPIDQSEEAFLDNYLVAKHLNKGEYFCRSGETTHHISFIESGALRAFVQHGRY